MNRKRAFIPRTRKQREGLARWRRELIDRQVESGQLIIREPTAEERERFGIKPNPASGSNENEGAS